MSKSYQCRIERHSVSAYDENSQAVTWVIRFPRRVLAEVVTHRTVSDCWGDWDTYFTERATTSEVSKNSASSRAIPFQRMIAKVQDDPFIPRWTLNRQGMQGDHVTDAAVIERGKLRWLQGMEYMAGVASDLHDLGIHKQDCNRALEPWAWVEQIVTGTLPAMNNFFALRTHEAADPHFRVIARMMYLSLIDSSPARLEFGRWHLPFVPPVTAGDFVWRPRLEGGRLSRPDVPDLIRHSAARCAWVSYENHDRDGTPEAMDRTFDRLLSEIPVHASPVEHQLTPLLYGAAGGVSDVSGNCPGWVQARKLIRHEKLSEFAPSPDDVARWREEAASWLQD